MPIRDDPAARAAVAGYRVAAYVIRHGGSEPQLLVFEQIGFPDAGTRIPAGGGEPGETSRDAVLRELAAEPGLTDGPLRRRTVATATGGFAPGARRPATPCAPARAVSGWTP